MTFNENDSPGDLVSTYQTLNAPADLTLFSALSPAFTNAGFVFTDWNSAADGSGTPYSDGELYSFSVGLDLYAQWRSTNVSVGFLANGGTGAIAQILGPIGSSVTIPSGNALSFANHSFTGWNTQPGGGGVAYQAGANLLVSGALTLYAQWATVTTVTVTSPPSPGPVDLVINFDVGGATGVLDPVSFAPGSSIMLPVASTLSNPGFTFAGWFTSSIGGQNLGQGGTILTPSGSETAFAQWTADLPATLSFSSNQGNGSVIEIVGVMGAVVTVSGSKGMLRQGYVFRGWNTAANASGTNYAIGSQFTLDGATTLYAQWSKSSVAVPETVLIGSVGPFMNDSTMLSVALRARIRSIADVLHSKKYISISLYGYDAGAGSFARHRMLSTQRAVRVDEYLRAELAHFGTVHIKMTVRGEGEIAGFTDAMFRRVEIFAN
ncbi:MAG: InlB B-repeat-containing protein [Acidimicrobiales bacterium]